MNASGIDSKYLLILAVSAGGILLFGTLLRPERTPRAVPSEAAALQQLSARSADPREFGLLLADRAASAAEFVVWAPEARSAAVRTGPEGAVAAAGDAAFVAVPAPPGRAPRERRADLVAGEWIFAVARTSAGEAVWTPAVFGGRSATSCGAAEVQELHLSAALPAIYAGAGVFDYDGALAGHFVRCGERVVAVPVREAQRLLASAPAAAGYTMRPLSAGERDFFGATEGSIVESVQLGSAAARAGLRPGDVLVEPESEGRLRVERAGRRVTLELQDAEPVRGLTVEDGVVRTVEPGSAAAAAGLSPGDRLIGVSGPRPRRGRIDAALRADGPVFVIYERAGTQRGVLLP